MIKPENYYVVHGWMATELKLSGLPLQVYAIIYGFSQDDKSMYNGGKQYLMEWCNCSERQIIRILKSLQEKGLIEQQKAKIHGKDGFAYIATPDKMSPLTKCHPCQNVSGTSDKMSPVTPDKMSPLPLTKCHPSTPAPSYSTADLPPAPYNNIKKDIKNKEDEEEAPAAATTSSSPKRKSFSLAPEGDEIPELDIPCENGITMYFTDGDIQDLKRGYVGVNVVAEIRKMQLQAKQAGKIYSLDRTRKRVYPWLQNVQNTAGANTQVSTKIYTIDPADPANKPKRKKTMEEEIAELPPYLREAYERGMAEMQEAKRKQAEIDAKAPPISEQFKKFLKRTAYSLDALQQQKEAQNDR